MLKITPKSPMPNKQNETNKQPQGNTFIMATYYQRLESNLP